MNALDLIAYFSLLVSITIAPGPLMAILVAKTIAGDVRGATWFGVGIAFGDVLVMAFVCAGLGLWLQSMPQIFVLAKLLAVIFILWIAFKIWNGTEKSNYNNTYQTSKTQAAFAGLITCLISPQTILLYLLLLPRLVNIETISYSQFSLISLITFGALAATFTIVIYFASRFRLLLSSGTSTGVMSRAMAIMVAISGVLIIAG